ncbi:MAG: LacI family DNA-binding transcriptional regulator [Acidimicrobiales bacterium]|nr:LacI family DNA-binding transcriptional regulator [Acidimicrobiales bacterium]
MNLPTLADVAQAVGVSRTTVSNAYNRPDQLSDEVRARILAAAEELGYPGPDPVARGLRRGRTGVVGLVYDEPLSYMFTDPAAVLFVTGLAGVFDEAGISLALLPRLRVDDQGGVALSEAAVDGLVSFCEATDDARVAAFVARRLPFVTVDGVSEQAPSRVVIDDRGGTRAATRHLLDLGHRRLAVAAFPRRHDGDDGPGDRGRLRPARLAGIRDAVEEAGLDWGAVVVEDAVDHGTRRAAGHRLGGSLLDREPRPTAVVAMSDELAAGVLDAAAERGIAVPDDLSVVGFDDTPTATSTRPALTTVHQPHVEKGRTAARLLLDGAPETVIELPTRLVVRASTGPAA